MPEQKDTFDRLVDAFKYRNWVAHGRYWHFKDNPNKFTFNAIWMLNEKIDVILEGKILTLLNVGESL